jgi:acyl carrier protein
MGKQILVVDDERDIVEIYRRALTQSGYDVICAYSGEDGLNILRANPIDLVVLDLKMPKMSGDEFLKVLRRDPTLKDTKVLVMSSVLYRYKEIYRYDQYGRHVRTDIVKDGLSKLGERANKTTEEEDRLEMEEKPKPRVEFDRLFGYTPEEESEFERRLSQELIKRVKKIFGEPYLEEEERFITAIESKVKEIITKMLKVDKEKPIYKNTSFSQDLGVAFIDAVALRRKLEKEFKVKISWENQENIKTVGDLIYCIEILKMQARTKKERLRKERREFWEQWRAYFIIMIIVASIYLLFFLWEMIKKILP